MEEFDLNSFLKKYKPKKKISLKPYLGMKILRGYKLMKNTDELIPEKMYIMYIENGNIYAHNKYREKDIEDGGYLVSGGYFLNGEYLTTDNRDEWTHLELKSNISKKTGRYQRYYSYYIKLGNYAIFYKKVDRNTTRDMMLGLLDLL